MYKVNVYTYKTDELPICYNLTAQNYAIQSIGLCHTILLTSISSISIAKLRRQKFSTKKASYKFYFVTR
mgnify:FL=1